MTRDEILLAHREYLFPSVFHYFDEPLVIHHAKDQFVWDADGNQYLDFFGGIVTVSVGHCNAKVNAKVHEQVDKLQHVSTLFATEPQVTLAAKTHEQRRRGERSRHSARALFTPDRRRSWRSGTPTTAVPPWAWPSRVNRRGDSVLHCIAYCYRRPFGMAYPDCEVRCATDVEELIRTTTSGRVAGMIAEPIQGVGGFIVPPREYFPVVAGIVRKYGGIFIADEVQTA